ncbi:MAG: hypothetical protein HYU66_16240 [Armatimonadetes bacterium]|nr:hypothetical protein [Armatimonadota bacterium]
MRPRLGRVLVGVVLTTILLQGVQHLAMLQLSMSAYHAVSAVLTLALVALAAWQIDIRTRWLEASARADELAKVNADLERALAELQRSDQLAAAGAVTGPLGETLQTLLSELSATGLDSEWVRGVQDVLEDLQALTHQSRKKMRPVDLGLIARWVAEDAARSWGGSIRCIQPAGPVWVKANPARLEMAVRHFLADAAGHGPVDWLVMVADAREGTATLAISSERTYGSTLTQATDTLNWQIAQAAVTEAGGFLTVSDEADGVVYTLHLPSGPPPGRSRNGSRSVANGGQAVA